MMNTSSRKITDTSCAMYTSTSHLANGSGFILVRKKTKTKRRIEMTKDELKLDSNAELQDTESCRTIHFDTKLYKCKQTQLFSGNIATPLNSERL
jgi:hypothetical protein